MGPWVLACLSASSHRLSRITGPSVLQISRCPNMNPQCSLESHQAFPLSSLDPNPKGPRGPLEQRRGTWGRRRGRGLHVATSDPELTGQSPRGAHWHTQVPVLKSPRVEREPLGSFRPPPFWCLLAPLCHTQHPKANLSLS